MPKKAAKKSAPKRKYTKRAALSFQVQETPSEPQPLPKPEPKVSVLFGKWRLSIATGAGSILFEGDGIVRLGDGRIVIGE